MKKLLLLALPFLLFSCSSDSDSSSSSGGLVYISGKLDGTSFNYKFNNNESDEYFYSFLTGFDGEGFDRWYYYGGTMYTASFSPAISIAWDNMVFTDDESVETATFYDAFGETPTNYLTQAQLDANLRGVDVQYEDNGTFYNTSYGSQAGSTFTVSSVTEDTDPDGLLQAVTVKGTFSCKVYNSENPADFKTITDGKFKLILQEYN